MILFILREINAKLDELANSLGIPLVDNGVHFRSVHGAPRIVKWIGVEYRIHADREKAAEARAGEAI